MNQDTDNLINVCAQMLICKQLCVSIATVWYNELSSVKWQMMALITLYVDKSQFLYDKLDKRCLVKLGQGGTAAYFDTEQ